MFKYFLALLFGNALILGSFMYLQGHMWGAIPALIGIIISTFSLGEVLEPFNKKLFKE